MERRPTRRETLLGLAALSTSLAGCGESGPQRNTPTDRTPTDGTGSTRSTDGTADGGGGPDGGTTATAVPPGERELGAELVAEGFPAPLGVETPQQGRHFVADQTGRVYLVADGSQRPVLDIRDRLTDSLGSEEGLLGLAFHPDFAENGRVFVRYSADPRPGTPDDFDHTFVLAEFRADPASGTVDPASERTVLEIPEPQTNHNSGAVVFGPDGYLYVGVGDGGAANDQGRGHVSDWYGRVGGGNGQDVTENLLGSILRIDVDGREDGDPYAIPADNPLVGREGLDEHYAWGLRNPWRMSFGPDGRLFVADVGQNEWEEVNVVRNGGNYGWNVYEGDHCFQQRECPTVTPDGERLEPPIIEYGHGGGEVTGVAVIGGYLYDGDALPTFRGEYVFADFAAQGRIFVATETETGLWPTFAVPVRSQAFGPQVTAFGEDAAGELLVTTIGDGGKLFRLTPG